MKPWEFEQIRTAVKGKWLTRGGGAAAGGRVFNGRICTDSRLAGEGDLFVAIAGKKHDAHDYVGAVVMTGVAGILVHREPAAEILAAAQEKGITILQTDDTVAGLNRLAAAYRTELRAKVIAVGGSNGKTTTKRIIHTLLSEKFGGHVSAKSFNNNIGMPLTLLEVEVAHEFVVLEIGTNAPGEIAALGEVARPDIAVITNIGLEHLEQLGDLEGVAREEAAIAGYVREGGTLVLPAEAPELNKALRVTGAQRITVGREGSGKEGGGAADLEATGVRETVHGVAFGLNGRGEFRLPLLGEHNALNALLAIAVARRLGLSDEQMQTGLDKVKPAPMRLEIVEVAGHLVVNDAYNANPSSMAAALQTFARLNFGEAGGAGRGVAKRGRPIAPGKAAAMDVSVAPGIEIGRRVAILGDMLELGSVSEAMHRNAGALVAAWKIPVFLAVGPAMRHAAEAAEAAGVAVHRFADTAAARRGVAALVQPGDVILLKGSRGMAMETILEGMAEVKAARPAPAPPPEAANLGAKVIVVKGAKGRMGSGGRRK